MNRGDVVADFELVDETGATRTLSGLLANGPVVLFFYPAALSPGCTNEACHFRDLAAEFRTLGAQPVGISHDSVDKQARFAALHTLGYPLLSDPDGRVHEQFGVRRNLIDTDRRILEVIRSELRMNVHADKALAALRARPR
jgi:peroxiredoxin Q/BCP